MILLTCVNVNVAKVIRSFIVCLFIAGVGISWCRAASLQISPIRPEMPDGTNATALNLKNTGSNPIHVQVRVFRWTQVKGKDVLTPSEELVISPPFIIIEPEQEQLIRVMRTANTPSGVEANYRLLVDELPDTTITPTTGIQFRLRYSLPIFVNRSNTTPASVKFSLQRADASWQLVATNSSTRSAQIRDAQIVDAKGNVLLTATELIGYALAGSQRVWPLKAATNFSAKVPLFIRTKVNNELLELPLNIKHPDY